MAEHIEVTEAWVQFWNRVLSDGDFTYDNIRERGGPSQPTLTKMLRVGESISPSSARALEDAIGLERGSVRSVAEGGAPRWRPEWNPLDAETPLELGYQDRGEHRRPFGSLEDGYTAAASWAQLCWGAGAPKDLYYRFIDVSVELYKAALDGRAAGAEPDTRPAPVLPINSSVAKLSDRRPTVEDLRGLPSAAEPERQDKGGEEDDDEDGEFP